MRRWILAVVLVAACGAEHPKGYEQARRACLSVRESVAGRIIKPERTFRILDRAVEEANTAAHINRRYRPLARYMQRFRADLDGPSSYRGEAAFNASAYFTGKECEKVKIDIGIT